MYQVIIMYGDNEPWWFFEEWEEDILEEEVFETFEEAKKSYFEKSGKLTSEYSMIKEKPDFLTAFWNEGELAYCDDCDDELQQYKGLMLLKDCHRMSVAGKENDETANYCRKTKCCKRTSQGARSN